MYSMQICVGNSTMNIPFNKFNDKFNDKYKDLNIFDTLLENITNINCCLINTKYPLDTIDIFLLDDDDVLKKTTIELNKKIFFMFSENGIESNFQIMNKIQELFDSLEKYIIEVENDEISRVILNDEEIDVNWFIKNIYKADAGRYYRKAITLNNMCVFTRDIKL